MNRNYARWTQKEILYVKSHYRHQTFKEIASKLGRTRKSVERLVSILGLKKLNKWTKEEIEFLVKYYSSTPKYSLIKRFRKINPNRTWISIFKKANKLGLKKITYKKEIDKILRAGYATLPKHQLLREVRKYLPRINYEALKMRAERLGLNRRNYAINEQTKKIKYPKPSKNLAWFLGVLAGDGYVRVEDDKHHSYVVTLSTISKEFAHMFKDVGEKLFGIKASLQIYKRYKLRNKWRKFWVTRFLSKQMVNFLGDWKETIWVNTLTLKFNWILKNKLYMRYFLSGLFDSDGSINKGKYTHRLFFAVKDKTTQNFIKKILDNLDVYTSVYSNGIWTNDKKNTFKLANLLTSYIPSKSRLLKIILKEYNNVRQDYNPH